MLGKRSPTDTNGRTIKIEIEKQEIATSYRRDKDGLRRIDGR